MTGAAAASLIEPGTLAAAEAASLRAALTAEAVRLGFAACGVADAGSDPLRGRRLAEWLDEGRHGTMEWMEARREQRSDPRGLWPEARSVIALGMSYAPAVDPMALAGHADRGRISVYAQGADYHDVVKKSLKALARWLIAEAQRRRLANAAVKVFVDTAPVMEKPLGAAAGLGWQGKHTNLVSREHGSWLLLGAIYTTLNLPPDEPSAATCGRCSRCIEACPTAAFPQPGLLDARRCISYLTIEHKGPIPLEFRRSIGNRIYGCDDCLAVCPWNKFADAAAANRAFLPRAELAMPKLDELLALDDRDFRRLFAASPIKRIGRDRFVRNCLIAAGNSGDRRLWGSIEPLLADADPVVAEAAAWALEQLRA
jgi:epoxyqueuosine reductase